MIKYNLSKNKISDLFIYNLKMNSNIDYKHKALKYKTKYLELKKELNKLNISGGIPEWYDNFEHELIMLFNTVNNYYPNVVLTGSGAIVYLLKHLEMNDELDNFMPNDLDFLYKSRIWIKNPTIIEGYKIKQGQENESSVTFILENNNISNFIKSFDISKIDNIKSFNFNGIEIINLNRLKSDYKPDFMTDEDRKESDMYKMNLIEKIIRKIHDEGRMNEFGLGDDITLRKPKRNIRTLFDDFNDDSNDDSNNSLIERINNDDNIISSPLSYNFTSPKKPKSGILFDDSDNEK